MGVSKWRMTRKGSVQVSLSRMRFVWRRIDRWSSLWFLSALFGPRFSAWRDPARRSSRSSGGSRSHWCSLNRVLASTSPGWHRLVQCWLRCSLGPMVGSCRLGRLWFSLNSWDFSLCWVVRRRPLSSSWISFAAIYKSSPFRIAPSPVLCNKRQTLFVAVWHSTWSLLKCPLRPSPCWTAKSD
jgi:hypothetical protein